MPNRIAFNDVAENLKVQMYGDEPNIPINLDVNGNLVVNGTVAITAINPIPITGVVGLNNSSVSVTGDSFVIIGGHGFTEINQSFSISTSVGLITTISVTTAPIDVSSYSNFTYYVRPQITGTLDTFSVQTQIAPTTTSESFYINSPSSSTTISSNGGLALSPSFLRYTRLRCDFHVLIGSISGTVDVYFQGMN